MILVLYDGYEIFFSDETSAANYLAKYTASIRLDLHGVLDILPKEMPLCKNRTNHTIVCISYVGENTQECAKKEIQARIESGQIDFGILVFQRGYGKEKNTFIDVGSKAWVNKQLACSDRCIFIDDSTDHLRSTMHLMKEDPITCVLCNTGIPEQLLSILSKWET